MKASLTSMRTGAAAAAVAMLVAVGCADTSPSAQDSPTESVSTVDDGPVAATPTGNEDPTETGSDDPRVEASKDEEPVLVYGSPPELMWQQVMPVFNELYPWITVETVDIQGPELVSRVESELASGASSADLIVDFSDTFNSLASHLQDGSSSMEDEMSDSRILAPGVYELEASPLFIMYNEQLLQESDVPTTWEGLLEFAESNPGKLSTYSIEGPPSVPNVKSFLAQDPEAWGLLEELAPLVRPEEGGGPIITKTSQGQYSLAYAMTGLVRGATVDLGVDDLLSFKLPTDVVTVMPRGIGVLAEAGSPNSAALFMDFMLSEEGQELMCTVGLTSTLPEAADTCGEYSLTNLLDGVDPDIVHRVDYSEEYFADREDIIETWSVAQRG